MSQALVDAGVLPDPSIATAAALRDRLVETDWLLTMIAQVTTGEQSPVDLDRYSITLLEIGDFHGQADCNRVLGSWSLNAEGLSITPGPVTGAACPPGSLSDDFIGWLGDATSAQIDASGVLIPVAGDEEAVTLLHFEAVQ